MHEEGNKIFSGAMDERAKQEGYVEGSIREVYIENFKCFEEFAIKEFNKINIFYGDNDSGKTALLEAIYISFSNINPNGIFVLLRSFPLGIVEGSTEDSWDLLFHRFEFGEGGKIKLNVIFENGHNLETEISKPFLYKDITIQTEELRQAINPHSLFISWKYGEAFREAIINIITPQELQRFRGAQANYPFIPVPGISVIPYGGLNFPLKHIFFFTSLGKPTIENLTNIYGEIVKENLKGVLMEAIRSIKPDVEHIDIINFAGVPCVAFKFKDDDVYYPISAVGEGFSKIFMLLSLMIKNRNGILLIDEIENGLYWEVQPIFWKFLEKFAIEFNVQLFITTHSFEFLKNIAESTENPESISGFKMKRIKGRIKYFELKGKDFTEPVREGIDVR